MLLEMAAKWGVELSKSFMVGDTWRDIEAGKAAGCKAILIDHRYLEHKPEHPDFVVSSLLEASQIVLSQT